MGGLFSKAKTPAQAVVPPVVPAVQPKQADEAGQNAANFLRLRRRNAFDRESTMLTQSSATGGKTLLGQ